MKDSPHALSYEIRKLHVHQMSDAHIADLSSLIKQLNPELGPITRADVDRVMRDPMTVVFIALSDGRIVGTLTLARFARLTSSVGIVETVVVDEGHRGQGIGRALLESALVHAKVSGIASISLTSKASRDDAHRLYARLGFRIIDTLVLRKEV